MPQPVFESNADRTLDTVRSTYHGRGEQYTDSWAPENTVTTLTKSTLARFGVTLSGEQMRLLQCAALIDVKDSRLSGKWNNDSMIDGIAYRACYSSLRDDYEEAQAAKDTPTARAADQPSASGNPQTEAA